MRTIIPVAWQLTDVDHQEQARARGAHWRRNRVLALRQANFQCTYPGCPVRRPLDVHHIVPLRCYAACDEALGNAVSNLRPLCRTHHILVERSVEHLPAHPNCLGRKVDYATRDKLRKLRALNENKEMAIPRIAVVAAPAQRGRALPRQRLASHAMQVWKGFKLFLGAMYVLMVIGVVIAEVAAWSRALTYP